VQASAAAFVGDPARVTRAVRLVPVWAQGRGRLRLVPPARTSYHGRVKSVSRSDPSAGSASRRTVFLLSPANCAGKRAQTLLRKGASSALAMRVRDDGAPIGDVFSFLSGLYFRGKLAYGLEFASPGDVMVITPGRGLVAAETIVTLADLRAIAKVGVATDEARYRDPLERDATALAGRLSGDDIDASGPASRNHLVSRRHWC
jgi:hypothetical protein